MRLWTGLLALAITAAAVADEPAVTTPNTAESPAAKSRLDTLATTALEELDDFAEEHPDRMLVIGLMERGERRLFVAGHMPDGSPPDEHTLFEIGSITKTFTGLTLASLVNDGTLRLDQTVREFVPKKTELDESISGITLEQLATHTSGLPRIAPTTFLKGLISTRPYGGSRATLNWNLSVLPPVSPSEHPSYSNLGVGLLGDIISRVEKKPFEDVVRERITGRLRLNDTVAKLSDDQSARLAPGFLGKSPQKPWSNMGTGVAAGGFRSTVHDLLSYAEAIIEPPDEHFAAALDLALQPRVRYEDEDAPHVGLCWHMESEEDSVPKLVWHTGGTFGHLTALYIIPKESLAVVVLLNGTRNPNLPRPGKLAYDMLRP